jgi:hypothetical protein
MTMTSDPAGESHPPVARPLGFTGFSAALFGELWLTVDVPLTRY